MLKCVLAAGVLLFSVQATAQAPDAGRNWPQWRGPLGTGSAPAGNPPTEWSEEKNVRWKAEIAGRAHSAPIIWGDRVYLQTAIETPKEGKPAEPAPPGGSRGGPQGRPGGAKPTHLFQFSVLALDRATGKTVWQRVVREEVPHESGHQDASQASASPVTDGKLVFAHFGSRGLYCLDATSGEVKWEKDFGDMRTRSGFGEGSSPALHGDVLVINWDHEGDDFIVALEKSTGKELWRAARDEQTSWATPVIIDHKGSPQVVTAASNRVRSYELKTGKVLWECSGLTANVIPTPVYGHGMVYVTSGFRGSALMAIKLDEAKGDISGGTAVAFTYNQDTPYVPSPVLTGERLYFLQVSTGILTCLNAMTGEKHYGPQRLDTIKGVYASPVSAPGRVYIAGRNGHVVVFKDAATFELIADNTLDDVFNASPAIAGDELYLRGENRLYCIAKP